MAPTFMNFGDSDFDTMFRFQPRADMVREIDRAKASGEPCHHVHKGWPTQFRVAVSVEAHTTVNIAQKLEHSDSGDLHRDANDDGLQSRFTGCVPLRLMDVPGQGPSPALDTMSDLQYSAVPQTSRIFVTPKGRHDYMEAHGSLEGDHAEWLNIEQQCSRLRIEMIPFTREKHTFPIINFRVEATWVVGGARQEKVSMFGLHANNIETSYESKPIATRADLRGRFQGPQGQDIERNLTGEITEFGVLCRGRAMYAYNLADNADFGPFSQTIRELAQMLDRGCKVYWATVGSFARDCCSNALVDIQNAKEEAFQPYADWGLSASKSTILRWTNEKKPLPIECRPKSAMEPRFNFLNLQEYTVITGFGFIQEYENSADSKERVYKAATCHLVHVEGAEERQLFLLVQRGSLDSDSICDVSPGDNVSATIHIRTKDRAFNLSWSGEVIEPRTFSQLSDISILVRRPYSDEDHMYLGPNPVGIQGISSVGQSGPRPLTTRQVRDSKSFTVDLVFQPDRQQFQRRVRTLAHLHETIEWEKEQVGHSITEQITLANSFQRLPIVDLFDGVSGEDIESTRRQLLPWQRDAFDSLRTQHGGLSLIVGPPGSGKSSILLRATLLHLRSKSYPHPQALILSPLNHNVDDLLSNIYDPSSGIVVIRLQSSATEKALLFDLIPPVGDLGRTTPRSQNRPKVNNRRLNDRNRQASLAYHALVAAGVMKSERPNLRYKAVAEGNNFLEFARFHRLVQSGEPSIEERDHFDKATENLFEWTLKNADVICATMERVADPVIYNCIRPTMIGADEQGKAHSFDSRVMHAYFPCCHHFVWVGDPRQARPQVRSRANVNGFCKQLELSEFTRLLIAGFPAASITTQRRYCTSINDMISPVFYKGNIRTDHIVDRHPSAMRFRQMTGSAFGLGSENIVLVDVKNAPQETALYLNSKMNKTSAAVTWHLLETLVSGWEFSPNQIAILTPMLSQRVAHDHIQARLKVTSGKTSYEDILVQTWEKVQGAERDIVIVDVTATDSFRFVSELTRLNTCLSRGKYGIIIVADMGALSSIRGYNKTALSEVFKIIRESDGRMRFDDSTMATIRATYLPLFPS